MTTPRQDFKAKLVDTIKLLTTTLLGLTLLMEIAGSHVLLERLTHFKVQYAGLFLIASSFLLFLRNKRWALLAFVGFCYNAIPVFQWSYAYPKQLRSNHPNQIKIFLFNVLTSNQNFKAAIEAISSKNPDLVCLIETSQEWLNQLEELKLDYPHVHQIPRDDNFGITLLSKLKLVNARAVNFGPYATPTIISEVELPRDSFTMILTHPLPPIEESYFHGRNEQMNGLAKFILTQKKPTILAGDLNMTPWSPYFIKFLKDSGMIGASKGLGWNPTWPQFPLFRIPIDHVLTTKNCQTISYEVLEAIGSDHNPVFTTINIE